ncbi:hypothetical protein GOBAR_AA07047 [Gossypium barbadense]|uniref:Uncharacterized protein n=1 Tax=Gossypium barbadense TaxID=3634 RepID=A0A2P5YD40_GOSBA|nr:hypothetical protein GOBAR_AA07047 [Gossypium barbadense]
MEGLACEVAVERQSKKATQVEVKRITAEHTAILEKIIREYFYLEEDPSGNEDVAPSIANNDVAPFDNSNQGVDGAYGNNIS